MITMVRALFVTCLMSCSPGIHLGPAPEEPEEPPPIETPRPQHRFPHVSPELAFDSVISAFKASSVGQGASIAFDGEMFLIVWSERDEHRSARTGWYWSVRTARVSATGEILDPGGTVVTDSALGYGPTPRVAARRGEFVIVWSGAELDGLAPDVRYARVRSLDGAILDPGGVALRYAARGSLEAVDLMPDVAFVDGGFVVVWSADDPSFTPSTAVMMASYRDNATSFGGGTNGTTQIAYGSHPRIAAIDNRVAVSWVYGEHCNGLATSLFTLDERPIDVVTGSRTTVSLSPDDNGECGAPAISALGSRFVVAWPKRVDSYGVEFLRHEFSIDGELVEPAPTSLLSSEDAAWGTSWTPEVELASQSDTLGVAMRVGTPSLVVRIGHLDGTIDPPVTVLDAAGTERVQSFGLALDSEQFQIVWHDPGSSNAGPGGVHRALITDDASITRQETLWGPSEHDDSTVASNGEVALVAWVDYRGNDQPSSVVLGMRVRLSDGTMLDREPLVLASHDGHDGGFAWLASSSDGDGFLVVWVHGSGSLGSSPIAGRRVLADGTMPDAAPFSIATGLGTTARVASNGQDYMVVYRSFRAVQRGYPDYETDQGIAAVRLQFDGTTVQRSPFTVAVPGTVAGGDPSAPNHSNPDIATNGTDYFVAWQRCDDSGVSINWSCSTGTGDIRVAQISSENELDIEGGHSVAGSVVPGFRPRIAHTGNNFLVVWEDRTLLAENGGDLHGMLLRDDSLEPASPLLRLVVTPDAENDIALTADEAGFLVAWSRTPRFTGERGDLQVVRVDPVESTGEVAVSARLEMQTQAARPALIPSGSGEFLGIYLRDDARMGRTRVRGRYVVFDANPLVF